MKKTSILAITILALTLSGASILSQVPESTTGNDGNDDIRKISLTTILNGIANSCAQLGKMACAKSKQEQQKEALNFAASVFQLAADVSQESKEKEAGKKEENDAVTAKTIDVTLELVNILENDTENTLKAEPTLYLFMLRNIPDQQAKRDFIQKILSDGKEAALFLEEIVAALQKVFMQTIPAIANDLLINLKNKFATITQ